MRTHRATTPHIKTPHIKTPHIKTPHIKTHQITISPITTRGPNSTSSRAGRRGCSALRNAKPRRVMRNRCKPQKPTTRRLSPSLRSTTAIPRRRSPRCRKIRVIKTSVMKIRVSRLRSMTRRICSRMIRRTGSSSPIRHVMTTRSTARPTMGRIKTTIRMRSIPKTPMPSRATTKRRRSAPGRSAAA